MATHREKFWTEDIIAAAILAASGGTALLLTKLRTIALEQHLPLLHTLVQWWPLLLIIGGLILLLTRQSRRETAMLHPSPHAATRRRFMIPETNRISGAVATSLMVIAVGVLLLLNQIGAFPAVRALFLARALLDQQI